MVEQQGSEVKAIKVKEIRRQKVYVPKSMTTNQVMEKYGLKPGAAYTARKKGFFVKNYSRPQVCVDPSKFNPIFVIASLAEFSNQTCPETPWQCL